MPIGRLLELFVFELVHDGGESGKCGIVGVWFVHWCEIGGGGV